MQSCTLEEKTVIVFEGNIDTAKCDAMEEEVCSLSTNANKPVEFDLTQVEFVSSSFLRLCILASQRAGIDRFRIGGANPSIKRVFKIAGLDAMLK
jgi:anti-sigma B factor antagonist